jgi:small subunit ribosomal protein S2
MQTPSLQQLLEAGVHFGHQVRRGHPKMRPYIYGAREGVHVIDLTISAKMLKEACDFAYELGKTGGVLLFIGTKKQAKPIIEEVAKKTEAPYLSSRWIGGFLTNFDEISRNIKKMKDLTDQKEKGQLSKYTKKEQLLIDRKIGKLKTDLAGASDLTKIPDALFIIDTVREDTAVKEARKINSSGGQKITVIAIADSNCDPSLIDYPIPGNDDAIKSIRVITEAVAEAYLDGLKAGGKVMKEVVKEEPKVVEDKDEVSQEVLEEVAVVEEEIEKAVVEDSERKS